MKVAVVGSRSLTVCNLGEYLPEGTTEIISGGARGIDQCAKLYAQMNRIPYTEYLPDYQKHGRRAPLIRNEQIVDVADGVIAFWDGVSRGTYYTVAYARKKHKEVLVLKLQV